MLYNLVDGSVSVALETRKGTPIPNAQFMEISDLRRYNADKLALESLKSLGRPSPMCRRRPATATYNCHGMTFANRRTGIQDPEAVAMLMREDGYKQIRNLSDVLPGDVALYYDKEGISHSGVVVQVEKIGNSTAILILSKWGQAGEYIHRPEDWIDFTTVRYFREAQDGTGPVRPD